MDVSQIYGWGGALVYKSLRKDHVWAASPLNSLFSYPLCIPTYVVYLKIRNVLRELIRDIYLNRINKGYTDKLLIQRTDVWTGNHRYKLDKFWSKREASSRIGWWMCGRESADLSLMETAD